MNDIRTKMLEALGLAPLEETILDKGIMKAIFLTGGAGSGKSTVIKTLFPTLAIDSHDDSGQAMIRNKDGKLEPVNIPSGADVFTPPPKVIDSDKLFTRKLDVAGLPQKMPGKGATDPAEIELYKKQMALRNVALQKINNVLKSQLNGYLSIIIDGTGKNPENMVKRKAVLERLGYDTFILIVKADLETSQRRNKKRTRSLPEKGEGSVEEIWHMVQAAIPQYKQMFGKNCFIADNNDGQLNREALRKAVAGFLNSPVQNPIGQELIATGKKGGSITRNVAPEDIGAFEQVKR
jgi:adenylate kinase